ncbi:MAG TPA: hypothetical protein VEV39_05095 [Gemmatimonadales bacterium]|nr:hypothetical protein [Gemmatimonadales bacterium]
MGSPAARLGQAAFLVLRLVDLLHPSQSAAAPDVFLYQASATERYARELDVESAEKALLLAVVKGARDAFTAQRRQLVTPALIAYGHFLEDTGLYEEALDVLDTSLIVGGEGVAQGDVIATTLRIARVHRKLTNFGQAYAAYEQAGSRALLAGDIYSELLSRIGRVNIVWGRGNLAEAEAGYRQLIVDAQAAHQRDAEARATQGLADTLSARGNAADAIPLEWRAFELYEDVPAKVRILITLGIEFRQVGDHAASDRALRSALQIRGESEDGSNAVLELMETSSLRGDRFGYTRWREEARHREPRFTPSMRVDFFMKQGMADARFGNRERGLDLLEQAIELARKHMLHEFVFRIEGLKHDLREPSRLEPAESAESVESESLDAVRAGLRELAAVD